MVLEKLSRVRPAASASRTGIWCSGTDGTDSAGSPAGTAPITPTPAACSAKSWTTTPATSIATSAAGSRGTKRPAASSTPRDARPTTSVGRWVRGRLPRNSSTRGKKPSASSVMPNRGPSWPRTMLSASPFMKPTRIGRDRKSAIAPRRSRLAARHMNPTSRVSIIASARCCDGSPPASVPTADATRAAAAAEVPTISCREVPSTA